ncbi:MAG: amidohydrolase family protein, partial [Planctomycetota bacterium]
EGRRAWNRSDPEEESATVLRAGTVWTGDGPPLTGGAEVLLRQGRIVAVGRSVPHPPGARILDAGPAAHVTPGFIDAQGKLGMDGGRVDARMVLGRIAEGSAFREDWLAVARSGVTTMVVAPRSIPGEGARLQAVKTAAAGPQNAFIQGHDIVRFDMTGGDHPARAENMRKTLDRGRKYFEKWEKYRKDRAEWEKKEAEKKSGEREESEAALRKRLAGTLEKKKEAAKEEESAEGEEEVEEAPKKADPINGLWHAVISSPMIPEPISVFFRLHHEGTDLHAVAWAEEDPSQTAEADGTFEDPEFRFEIPTNFGSVSISGEIDAEDHLHCNVNVGGLGSVEFEADRIEIEEEEAGNAAPRKHRKKGEGPQPPPITWALEGLRSLYEGRGVALVAADRADEIRAVVEMFRKYKLPVRILGGGEAWKVADLLRKENVGVVVGPGAVHREKGRDVVPAARLSEQGIATAFQSGAGIGARFLPDSLALAARYGLGEEEALRGITSAAASILGIGDRVGRLAAGLDGDAVVLNGPPFDLRSRVLHVFINGREVPRQ